MANSGMRLPGIFCPDESLEQFASLYANDNAERNIIMSSVLNPYNLPRKMHPPVHQSPMLAKIPAPSYNVHPPVHMNGRYLKEGPRYRGRESWPPRPDGYGDQRHYPHPNNVPPRERHVRQDQYSSVPQQNNMQFNYQPPPGLMFPWL